MDGFGQLVLAAAGASLAGIVGALLAITRRDRRLAGGRTARRPIVAHPSRRQARRTPARASTGAS